MWGNGDEEGKAGEGSSGGSDITAIFAGDGITVKLFY